MSEQSLEGREVVVTGGAGALGRAVVGVLLERGARCHVPALTREEAEGFAHAGHERVRVVAGVDLSDESAAERFYGGVEGPLWASVHLAGGFAAGGIEEMDGAEFERLLRMNAVTCYLSCRQAIRKMSGGGRIVNVAARPGVVPETGGGMSAYTASKAAVAALTRALGAELAGRGILVNAVVPSIIDTPANRRAMPGADHGAWPRPEEIAGVVAWLVSPGNVLVRGGLVPVYGRC